MRSIRHHAIIITGNDKAKLETLRKQVISLYTAKMEAKKGSQLISPIVESLINNFFSFFIAPDGSKEGYDASDDGDTIRGYITDMIEKYKSESGENPFRYVELYYGDEHGESKILKNN